MPQLVDFNQAVVGAVFVAQTLDREPTIGMVRHLVLNTFVNFNSQFREQYGNIVICQDTKHSWRKDIFPYYKAKRKANRADSPVRWDLVFEAIDTLPAEFEKYLPYKVVSVDGAEGDDIIATIVKYHQTNDLSEKGLVTEPQPCIILSTDTDFLQLHAFEGVKQWSPRQKKFLSHPDPKRYLVEKILEGDRSDGVPNYLSDDDTFVTEGKRSKKIMSSKMEQWLEMPLDQVLDSDEKRRNFARNKRMIDLIECVPPNIEREIIGKYASTTAPRSNVMGYLIDFQLRNLMDKAAFL